MNTHPGSEQLSAYIDGEVSDDERTTIEQHLTGCSECATTVRGLRATVADLRALPAPAPSPQESWALRAAVNRARKRPAMQYRGWVIAAGSVAAVIALIAISLNGTASSTFSHTGTSVFATDNASPSTLIQVVGTNYTSATITSLIFGPPSGGPHTPVAAPESGGTVTESSKAFTADRAASYTDAIQRCESVVLRGSAGARTPLRYVVATYEGTPVFILVYRVRSGSQDKTELWVVQRSDCYIRFFVPPR